MAWVQPQLVLSVLGVFLLGYGVSLVIRTRATARWRRMPRHCPECRRDWVAGAERCGACGFAAPDQTRRKAGLWRFGGVLFGAVGFTAFLGALVVHDWWIEESGFDPGDNDGFEFGPVLGAGLALSAVGLWVAVAGYRGQRAAGRRRCPKCWYLIDAAVGMKCSECGHEAKRERDLFRPRRRWRVAALGVVLIGLGQLGWMEGRVRRGGWVAAVPTEVLILGMPWLPEEWVLGENAYFVPVSSEFDEDWSLVGRLAYLGEYDDWGGHAWGWHEGFAAWRADGLIGTRSSPQTILRALTVKPDPTEDWDGTGEEPEFLSPEQERAILGVILASMDSPDPRTVQACGWLWEWAAFGMLPAEFTVWAELEPHAARLIEIAADASHPLRTIAATLCAYLDDRPGLVEALHGAARDGDRESVSSLVALVPRSERARRAVVELLASPEHRRHTALMISIMHPEDQVIRETLRGMLDSDDAEAQRMAAVAIWRYEPPAGEAERRIAELIAQSPEQAPFLVGPLRRFDGAMERHAGLFLGMSHSPDLAPRTAAVSAFGYLLDSLFRGPEGAAKPTEMQRRAAERLRAMAASESDRRLREEAGWMVESYDRWCSEPAADDEQ